MVVDMIVGNYTQVVACVVRARLAVALVELGTGLFCACKLAKVLINLPLLVSHTRRSADRSLFCTLFCISLSSFLSFS